MNKNAIQNRTVKVLLDQRGFLAGPTEVRGKDRRRTGPATTWQCWARKSSAVRKKEVSSDWWVFS